MLTLSTITGDLILWMSVALYLFAGFLIAWDTFPSVRKGATWPHMQSIAIVLSVIACFLHFAYTGSIAFYGASGSSDTFELVLDSRAMIVLISAILVLTFLLLSLGLDLIRLGLLVFPLTALSLIFADQWGQSLGQTLALNERISSAAKVHLITSILGYTFITLAAIQALVFKRQEAQFKRRASSLSLALLPPLETMERLLFSLLGVGTILLTLTLLSGLLFSQSLFGKALAFNHHVVLAILGWSTLTVTWIAYLRSKIRGPAASKWIVIGFLLIQLGYFGTKLITELIQ